MYFLFSLFIPIFFCQQVHFPVSFTVVRTTSPNLNLSTYYNATAFPSFDSRGVSNSYNIVALDGYLTSTTTQSLITDSTPLAFWNQIFERVMGMKKTIAGVTDNQVQTYILNKYHQRKSNIVMNAFSNERPVSISNADPFATANNIQQMINSMQLDGVSIDFQDFHAVAQNSASPWLQTLLKTLRNLMPTKLIILQIHPTFVSKIDLFKKPEINSYVDVFILKYFNMESQDYTNFQSLFTQSNYYLSTSLFQIQQIPQIQIDICKTIIAKPAQGTLPRNSQFFISASSLNSFITQANTQTGWFGGYANLDFAADFNQTYQMQTLSGLRDHCSKTNKCTCK